MTKIYRPRSLTEWHVLIVVTKIDCEWTSANKIAITPTETDALIGIRFNPCDLIVGVTDSCLRRTHLDVLASERILTIIRCWIISIAVDVVAIAIARKAAWIRFDQ